MADILNNATQIFELTAACITAFGLVITAIAVAFRPVGRAVGRLLKWIFDRIFATRIENEVKQQEKLDNLVTLLNEIRSANETQNERQNKELALIKDATLASTRNTLTYLSRKARERGNISSHDQENYEKMYQAYIALGGNSYVHILHDEYMKLPVVD